MTLRSYDSLYQSPTTNGIYALYAGAGRVTSIVYVGSSGNIRRRLSQHLEYRDTSVATGAAAATLNVDSIKSASWWIHPRFKDKIYLAAAELIAFDVFTPTLRSRARVQKESIDLSNTPTFINEMHKLFQSQPAGTVSFPYITDAVRQINSLENRVSELEEIVAKLSDPTTNETNVKRDNG